MHQLELPPSFLVVVTVRLGCRCECKFFGYVYDQAMSFKCIVCQAVLAHKSALETHQRLAHQDHATVTFADGNTLSIKRRDCGDGQQGFPCPNSNCTYWNANPQHLHRHCKRCSSVATITTTAVPAEIPDQSDSTPHSNLADYGLVADPDLCILICRRCEYAINPSPRYVRDHLRENIHVAFLL